MSSIKIFNFILKTRSTISGRSDGVSPGGRAPNISAHAEFDVKVTKGLGNQIFNRCLCSLGTFGTNI
jgi:hypothetical protein